MPAFWIDIFQNGSNQTYPFDAQSVTFGRDKSADFVLDHPTVSRQHGRIVMDHSGGFRLQVLSQGGMTALNGQRVQGEVPIQSGASINFGQIQLVFRAEGAPSAQAGGFGQAPGGFGQAPGGFGQPPGGGFNSSPGGGFGAPPVEATPSQVDAVAGVGAMGFGPSGGADEAVDAIGGAAASHWEAYANEREADMNDGDEPDTPEQTDFDRMAAASAKNNDGGVNPVLIVAVLLAAGFAAYMVFAPQPEAESGLVVKKLGPLEETLLVQVKCLSKDDCLEKANEAYKIGLDNYEKKSVHISNLFDSYKKMLEAEAYLAEEELPMPDELKGLEQQKKLARDELDKIFMNYRVSYKSKSKVEM